MELTLDNLSCQRGGRTVLRDISFHLEAGRAAILRGPNGAGKSTLLRLIAGLLPASAGDVRLGEISLRSDRSAIQERVAYSGHLDAVKPALTVHQNLSIWSSVFGGRDVDAALSFFGLDRIAKRPAAQCSAGQKRRLGLARLMVMERPLWLLDEPTVSLDAASSELVADLIRKHCASGGLALIATHIDLGLDNTGILELSAHSPAPFDTGEADAFLTGNWE